MKSPAYVSMAHPDHWVVKHCFGLWWPLWKLGFRGFPFLPWMRLRRRRPMGFEEMARIADRLRALGVAFSAGHDWSPSAVVQDLRDRGLFAGSFVEIAWTGPDRVLRDV